MTDLFFITGAPKSGTTWLQKALDAHPEIVCGGEGHFANVWFGLMQKAVILYNEQLKKVEEQVYEGKPYYTGFTQQECIHLAKTGILMMLNRLSITPHTRWIGDKTPAYCKFINELHLLFPEAKYIHIIRDGRDAIVSRIKHIERISGQKTPVREFVVGAAIEWRQYNEEVVAFADSNPGKVHFVKYEDLIQDFEKEMQAILSFLGKLDSSTAAVDICKAKSSFHALSGGRNHGQEDISSFYRKGVAGEWKLYFDKAANQQFLLTAYLMMIKFGYYHPSDNAEIYKPEFFLNHIPELKDL